MKRTPEQIVHDILLRRARSAVNEIYTVWKKYGRIKPYAFIWAAEHTPTDDGKSVVDDVVVVELDDNPATHKTRIQAAMQRVPACAVLLVRQDKNNVRARFESKQGSVLWRCSIISCGGKRGALSKLVESVGEKSLLSSVKA